ncbi:hypothetical protein NL676_022577 [Syzygium grande]|nr:hypothetical protein NL676_022577 [Syzygium grande]
MNWVVLEICCAVASAGVPFLVALGFLGLLCLLDDRVEGMGTAAIIEVTASASVFLLCMYLMLILTDYIVDSLADVPVNQDHKRIGRRNEEEREKMVRDLFDLFPYVSYTSQGIGSESGDCAICLGDFMEAARKS